MAIEHNGREYRYDVCSDIIRDGMSVEVSDQHDGTDPILEIFYSEVSHEMSVTLFKPSVPLEVVEWAISAARKRLPV